MQGVVLAINIQKPVPAVCLEIFCSHQSSIPAIIQLEQEDEKA